MHPVRRTSRLLLLTSVAKLSPLLSRFLRALLLRRCPSAVLHRNYQFRGYFLRRERSWSKFSGTAQAAELELADAAVTTSAWFVHRSPPYTPGLSTRRPGPTQSYWGLTFPSAFKSQWCSNDRDSNERHGRRRQSVWHGCCRHSRVDWAPSGLGCRRNFGRDRRCDDHHGPVASPPRHRSLPAGGRLSLGVAGGPGHVEGRAFQSTQDDPISQTSRRPRGTTRGGCPTPGA